MEFRVLGPLEVSGKNGPLRLGGAKQQAVLALLVLNANRVVSRERLIDGLWGDEPPETAVTSVQVYVSRLRKLLPEARIATRGSGYVFEADPGEVDLCRFERLLTEARAAESTRDLAPLQGCRIAPGRLMGRKASNPCKSRGRDSVRDSARACAVTPHS